MALFMGLMSGTSMDGIDAALVDLSTHTLIAGITRPYSEMAQSFLQAVLRGEQTGLHVLSQLNTVLGREFALAASDVLKQADVSPEQVVAIGSHGQTICHDAQADIPYTVQLGCAHTIAELTGISVVADFRTRDVVLGGQGAPFAPLYHQALFGSLEQSLAVVNVGGIANVTFISPYETVSGYDTGPGNALMDAWAQSHLGCPYDKQGAWAATGCVIKPLLAALLKDAYFDLPAPKSIDKAYFSERWLAPYLLPDFEPHDVQATLIALTATTIARAIAAKNASPACVVVCGGGVHNEALMDAIRIQLPGLSVVSTASLGVDPDFLEAMMFAWFAQNALNHVSLDLTRITGAKHPSILGAIYLSNAGG